MFGGVGVVFGGLGGHCGGYGEKKRDEKEGEREGEVVLDEAGGSGIVSNEGSLEMALELARLVGV